MGLACFNDRPDNVVAAHDLPPNHGRIVEPNVDAGPFFDRALDGHPVWANVGLSTTFTGSALARPPGK